MRSGGSQEEGTIATMGSLRHGVIMISAEAGCGLATMPMSKVPALRRLIDSLEPTASRRTSTPGLRAISVSNINGKSRVLTPADIPTRTTPSRPEARR